MSLSTNRLHQFLFTILISVYRNNLLPTFQLLFYYFLTGGIKPKSLMVTTSPHLSPEVLSATTVAAPLTSSVHHHHYNDVTSQDGDTLKRKKRKAKKQQDDVLFCNFPTHEGLVSRVPFCNLFITVFVTII